MASSRIIKLFFKVVVDGMHSKGIDVYFHTYMKICLIYWYFHIFNPFTSGYSHQYSFNEFS